MSVVENVKRVEQTGYGVPVETTVEQVPKRNAYSRKGESKAVVFAQRQKSDRYKIQEAKRASKVQIDQKLVLVSWIIAVGVAFITSAVVSFNGITAVSVFVGLSAPWLAYLFFFFIELLYLIFLVAYLILASQVNDETGLPEKTSGALLGMWTFAGISIAANAFHTLDYWQWAFAEPRMYAGIVLSVAAPLAIITASKLASRVVFARAITA
jgi:hypothetical protein